MQIIKDYIILGFLVLLLTPTYMYCQESTPIDSLISQEKYDNVISLLVEKESHTNLSTIEYGQLIKSYYNKNDFANGMLFSEKLIQLALLKNDSTEIVKSHFEKMKGLYFLYRLRDAITIGEQTIPFLKEEDSVLKTDLYLRLGILYNEANKNDRAYQLYKDISIAIIKEKNLEGSYYTNFANIYNSLGKIDSSFIFLKKALWYDKQKGSFDDILSGYSNISNIYINKNQADIAIKYLDTLSTKIFRENKEVDLYKKKIIANSYYRAYSKLRDIDVAFFYVDELRAINEEIYDERLENEITALKNSYKREENLKQKIESSGLELEKSKQQGLWIAIALLVLLIVLGIITVAQRFKRLKTQRDTVVMEQRLLRSQMTPHFIFNSLSVIQGMILNNENKKASNYLSKFSRLVRMILENSRFKMVTIESELLTIQNYIELQNSRFSKNIEYNIGVDDILSLKDLIPPMIIQPFVENVIEHGFKSRMEDHKLELNLKKTNNSIECTIIDNGIGIESTSKNTTTIKKSLSTTISKERLNILAKELKTKGDIVIKDRKTQNKKGTIVTITIPFKIT